VPIQKYRSVEDVPPPPGREPLDPGNLRMACDLSRLAARLRPRRVPGGVHKYRSVDEASQERARWEIGSVSG
jgi:hypothetical protein